MLNVQGASFRIFSTEDRTNVRSTSSAPACAGGGDETEGDACDARDVGDVGDVGDADASCAAGAPAAPAPAPPGGAPSAETAIASLREARSRPGRSRLGRSVRATDAQSPPPAESTAETRVRTRVGV